jgi:hypothetical protein
MSLFLFYFNLTFPFQKGGGEEVDGSVFSADILRAEISAGKS